jgi:tRNA G18 (ribose-2'-O)-methylase SpoU
LGKVSLGAEKTVAWESARNAALVIDKLKRDGYKIFAVEQSSKSIPYYKLRVADNKQEVALVVGNEVKGLPPAILKRADKILEIPMSGKKESLNVAVAFGIVIFGLRYTSAKIRR